MRAPWLILAVALYVALDVANPLMPGALTFGIEESVEVRQAERFRPHHHVVLPAAARASEWIRQIDDQPAVIRIAVPDVAWTPPARVQLARSSLSSPLPSPEDH
jgi:hypothetical protein